MPSPRIRSLALAAVAAAAPFPLAAQQWDPAADSKTLVLKAQGSFFAGGELTEIEHSAFGGTRPGTIWDGAMYVRYMIPATNRPKPSIVLWSGGCHVGTSFETTPDGREGWDQIFVRAGYSVYVVDATYRGRSPISAQSINAVRQGAAAPATLPNLLTCDKELAVDATPGFRLRGSNFPEEAMEQYLAQLVPDWFFSVYNGPGPNMAALIALLEKIGPSVVLAHSQGGLSVYPTLAARPDLFLAYVAVEALGSCTAITPDYPTTVPILAMSGDPIYPGVPPPFGIENCRQVAQTHENLTVDYLPEHGIYGNSHMMMLDRNNEQIAERIMDWIESHVDLRGR